MSTFFDLDRDQLETYRPDSFEPADFDVFWATTLEENPFDPRSVQIEEVSDLVVKTHRVFDVTFGGYAGDPIKAWLTIPATAQPGEELPTIVEFRGYGGGRGLPYEHLGWAGAGFAHLVMDNRGQGGNWGTGADTIDPHPLGVGQFGLMTRGIEDPHDYYFRRIYIDAHHAVEATAHLPHCDAKRIIVTGQSQGGTLSVVAGILNPRVLATMPDVAWMADFRRAVGLSEHTPYQEVVRYLSVFRGRDEMVFETLAYFDIVSLGKRATIPALFSTGLMDICCPPSTVYAVKNWWGEKVVEAGGQRPSAQIDAHAFNEHEGGGLYQWHRQVLWVKDFLGLAD